MLAALLIGATGASASAPAAAAASLTPTATKLPVVAALSAGEREAGLWYADRLKFDELQAAGYTGQGIKIAVIDAAINPAVPELSGADVTVKGSFCAFRGTGESVPATSDDPARSSHGTDVVTMLVGNGIAGDGGPGTRGIVPDAEVLFYAVGSPEEVYTTENTAGCEAWNPSASAFHADSPAFEGAYSEAPLAARQAIEDGADLVVISMASAEGIGWAFAVTELVRAGVPLVASTVNPTGNMSDYLANLYPFSLNGVVAVSGIDNDGNLLHGGGSDVFSAEALGSDNLAAVSAASALLTPGNESAWGPTIGSGTSLATPLVAGTIALGMQAHPEATANQVLQAMIRTTGGQGFVDDPQWVDPQWGYGVANPTALIASDPASLPDENPLFVMSHADPRCASVNFPSPQSMDECEWAFGPTAENVWPAGQTSNVPGDPVSPSEGDAGEGDEGGGLPALVWIAVGVVGLGLVITAILVPVILSRSRKQRAARPQSTAPASSQHTNGVSQ